MISVQEIPAAKLQPEPGELAARLQTKRDVTVAGVQEAQAAPEEAICCRFCWIKAPILRPAENTLDFGFGAFFSKDLTKNLDGCAEAFLFAVTLGLGVDRLLLRLAQVSQARHFITDALASALAEAACDQAEARIKGALSCKPRFSPGYGDLPLEMQKPLLNRLEARQRLGITLTQNLLMVPTKSITAIMGIYHENRHS